MSDLRLEYQSTIDRLGTKEELDSVKTTIQELDQRQGSSRMKASAERKAQKDVDRMKEKQSSSRYIITMRFIGDPNSNEISQQYDQLQAQHESRKKRFISIHDTPSPKGIQPFTDEYIAWFMKGATGANIYKSANDTGNNPMSGLNEDQKHGDSLHLCPFQSKH